METQTHYTQAQSPAAELENSRSWFGTLTVENAEAVGNKILAMLDGKRYTYAKFMDGCQPEVNTSRELTPNDPGFDDRRMLINTTHSESGKPTVMISFHDNAGIWWMESSARKGDHASHNGQTYITFSDRLGTQQLHIEHFAHGRLVRRVIAVERAPQV